MAWNRTIAAVDRDYETALRVAINNEKLISTHNPATRKALELAFAHAVELIKLLPKGSSISVVTSGDLSDSGVGTIDLAVTLGGGITPVLGQLRAFPFAQGYKVASTLTGGRLLGGGEVRKVTNLNDSGAGSLRQALSTAGPADVIFEVAGVISSTATILVGSYGVDSNITIWGETAPSPGITLSQTPGYTLPGDTGFKLQGRNLVVRHLRFRMNAALNGTTFRQVGADSSAETGQRAIFANCSFAYNADEMVDIVQGSLADAIADVTLYRCILGPGSGVTNKALLLSGWGSSLSPTRIALIQNFFGLTRDRTPEFHSGVGLVGYNNYTYACGNAVGTDPACFAASHVIGAGVSPFPPCRISWRGNRYEGNATNNRPQFEFDTGLTNSSPQHESYFDDNVGIVRCVQAPTVVIARSAETDLAMVLPEVASVLPSAGIKEYVLARVGARPLDRDAVDLLSVTNAQNGTGTVNPGAPPAYALGTATRALDVPTNWSDQAPGEAAGWRVLDVWLRQYAIAVGDLG